LYTPNLELTLVDPCKQWCRYWPTAVWTMSWSTNRCLIKYVKKLEYQMLVIFKIDLQFFFYVSWKVDLARLETYFHFLLNKIFFLVELDKEIANSLWKKRLNLRSWSTKHLELWFENSSIIQLKICSMNSL
jgi:hypothetical protein